MRTDARLRVLLIFGVTSLAAIAQAQPATTSTPEPAAVAPGAPSSTEQPWDERLSIHAQSTFIIQYHPPFHAPYSGPLSLDSGNRADSGEPRDRFR